MEARENQNPEKLKRMHRQVERRLPSFCARFEPNCACLLTMEATGLEVTEQKTTIQKFKTLIIRDQLQKQLWKRVR